MTSQTKIRIIKAVCWVGAAADALWAVALVCPRLYGILTGNPGLEPDLSFRLTMGIGASLMAGWTLLLAWAAANPIERRGVMLLTLFPVITGLFIVTAIGIIAGNTSNIWLLGKLLVLGAGMGFGYHQAGGMARERNHENNPCDNDS